MPVNEASEARKKQIVVLLKQHLGSLCKNHPHRPDWYSSEDGSVDVFVTDSKAHYHQRPWFDMRHSDLKTLAQGSSREDVLKLGAPASRITMMDDGGHLVEIFRYQTRETTFGVVRLSDGSVSSVQVR